MKVCIIQKPWGIGAWASVWCEVLAIRGAAYLTRADPRASARMDTADCNRLSHGPFVADMRVISSVSSCAYMNNGEQFR